MVVMFTDIVGSVDMKTRLGNVEAVELIAAHDALFTQIIGESDDAQILKDTGDGFLARFGSASEAVLTALRFQEALHRIAKADPARSIQVRIGIHLGEVSELDLEHATGIAKISGLAVDFTARLMSVALPGQILLTRAAFDNARQYVRRHPPPVSQHPAPLTSPDDIDPATAPELKWMAHGPYYFQGNDEPMEVFEVGAVGIAPLRNPPDSEKASRASEAVEDETLGWRPASGLDVPGRVGWVLERNVGQGGFGEVWLARNARTGSQRVFKFCHDAERLRSFKRELTLIRLMRDALGERQDIARLYEVRLDEPPFYLESEYTDQGTLSEWALREGGIERIPLEMRLDLMARIAEAVSAAHSVGVLHKDIKPDNILIYLDANARPMPRLSDFGIGMITDVVRLKHEGLSDSALDSLEADDEDDAVFSGSPIYAPPEALSGGRFTMQGDMYALGVLLYQMVVGDLARPLASGWERDITEPLLRRDIAESVEGREDARLASAKVLAERLRTLPQRRRAELRKKVARLASVSAGALVVLLAVAGVLLWHEHGLRTEAQRQRIVAEHHARRAQTSLDFFVKDFVMQSDPAARRQHRVAGPDVTIASALHGALEAARSSFADDPDLRAEILRTIGLSFKNLSIYDAAEHAMREALEIRQSLFRNDHPSVAESLMDLADVLWFLRRHDDALALYEQSLLMRERLYREESIEVAETLNNMAAALNSRGDRTRAEELFRRALDIRRSIHRKNPDAIDPMLIAASQNNLAVCLREQAKYDEAKHLFRQAIETARSVGGDRHYYVAQGLHNYGLNLARMNEYDAAIRQLREALDMKREVLATANSGLRGNLRGQAGDEIDHVSIAETLHALADVIARSGGVHGAADEAIDLAREALTIRSRALPETHPEIASTEILLGRLLARQHHFEEAEQLMINGLERYRARFDANDPRVRNAVDALIALYEDWERPGQADRLRAMRDNGQ